MSNILEGFDDLVYNRITSKVADYSIAKTDVGDTFNDLAELALLIPQANVDLIYPKDWLTRDSNYNLYISLLDNVNGNTANTQNWQLISGGGGGGTSVYSLIAQEFNDEYTSTNPSITSYADNVLYIIAPVSNNTGSATYEINNLGALPIKKLTYMVSFGVLSDLTANDLLSNGQYILLWRTSYFYLISSNITGLITAGTNVTIGGGGTLANPYVINSSGGGGGGTVTSVGLTMPSAFTVANSPITTSGDIAVTGAGTASQYVRGDGVLATLPTNGGGGGASVNYYLNGSVNQGTFGGSTYYELSKTAVTGAGTNFNRNTDGLIAQFITDANDPSQLLIPSGNWNFEFFFSASSSGGNPSFYVELLKYSGTTFTLIASSQSAPEGITNGTTKDSYFTPLAVPETVLLATDRLAIRVYITASGRTITLHTEDNNLCQVITTFTTGLTALNGLTKQVQYFAVGSTGTDFGINSATDTHTFNLPTASSTNRGALSSTDWSTFNGKLTPNAPITGATKTKITYDANGLVTAGADLSASDLPTGIDATKIGDGSVSNTEFQYLDGVTSNIQTQINNISQADEIEFAMVASFKSLYNF
jgi:hypothetical protein